ncbi:hypothetical protein [Ferrimonas senticii]|uniref:hypothetical protein n=1 Tax=Ferrimonas senticii TaxID=394566 RepID=UPI0003F5ADF9|nr:hypothetical protein [Ferrimonas senticii]
MKSLTLLASLLVTTSVYANDAVMAVGGDVAEPQRYQCQLASDQRVIEVRYPQGTSLPCEVVYQKQGESQVLWSALNTEGYCADKAAVFADLQRSWGWNCQLMTDTASE